MPVHHIWYLQTCIVDEAATITIDASYVIRTVYRNRTIVQIVNDHIDSIPKRRLKCIDSSKSNEATTTHTHRIISVIQHEPAFGTRPEPTRKSDAGGVVVIQS